MTSSSALPAPSPSVRLSARAWTAIAALFVVIFVGAMFSPALLDDADATHAEAAREMAVSGDFVTLHVNGIRYLEKAPLPYWLVALSYRVFGVSVFATRLPFVLAILGLIVLAAHWGARAFGARTGAYAGVFLATAFGIFLFTRIFLPEALLACFIAAGLYAWLTALERSDARRWYAGYACMALAVLTKGLIGIVFMAAPALLLVALSGTWRRWREFRIATGLLLFLVIAAPWHILAGIRNPAAANHPGFFWFYFVNEHFLRFLGKRIPRDYNKLPTLAYWGLHLVWLFPWSLYLPLLFRRTRWRQLWRGGASFAEQTRLLCWLWAGFVLLFFSFSTNQEYYTFPAYFPCLLLLADAVGDEVTTAARSAWLRVGEFSFVLLGGAAAAALGVALWRSRALPFVPDIGTALVERGVGDYTLSLSHFFDLTGAAFAGLRLPALIAAAALAAGAVAVLLASWRRRHEGALAAMAVTAALFFVAAHLALIRFEPYLSSKPLADAIAPELAHAPQPLLAIYGDQSYGSSLLFYLRRPIVLVNGRSSSMLLGSEFSDAPAIFWDDAALVRRWDSGRPILLFVTSDQRAQVERLLPHARVVAESSGKKIYTNR